MIYASFEVFIMDRPLPLGQSKGSRKCPNKKKKGIGWKQFYSLL